MLTGSANVAHAGEVAQINESTLIAEVVQGLARRYAHLPPDEIVSAVHDARTRFEQSPIRDFVPLLVERRAPNSPSARTAPGH